MWNMDKFQQFSFPLTSPSAVDICLSWGEMPTDIVCLPSAGFLIKPCRSNRYCSTHTPWGGGAAKCNCFDGVAHACRITREENKHVRVEMMKW